MGECILDKIKEKVPVKTNHIRTRKQGEDLALFNIMTAEYTVLNKTAAQIYNLCDGEHTAADIAKILIETYPEAPDLEEVISDVYETVQLLINRDLVEQEVDFND